MNRKDKIPDDVQNKIKQLEIAFERLKRAGLDKKFKKKWRIPERKRGQVEAIEKWGFELHSDPKRLAKYKQNLAWLIKEIESPRKFENSLENYLLLNVFTFSNSEFEIKLVWNEGTQEKELWIRVFGTTRKDDIRDPKVWRTIKGLQRKLPDFKRKNSEWLYFPEHKEIFRLKQIGKRPKEIAEIMSEKGYKIDEFEVRKTLSRYKKKMRLKSQR